MYRADGSISSYTHTSWGALCPHSRSSHGTETLWFVIPYHHIASEHFFSPWCIAATQYGTQIALMSYETCTQTDQVHRKKSKVHKLWTCINPCACIHKAIVKLRRYDGAELWNYRELTSSFHALVVKVVDEVAQRYMSSKIFMTQCDIAIMCSKCVYSLYQ